MRLAASPAWCHVRIVLTVSLVHFGDLECILSAADHIMIQFNIERCGGQLGTGEFGDGGEIEAIEHNCSKVEAYTERSQPAESIRREQLRWESHSWSFQTWLDI